MRRAVYGITVAAWLVLCYRFCRGLVADAADSAETYTRSGGFQLLNFATQYLWAFLIALAIVLMIEWAIFRALSAAR